MSHLFSTNVLGASDQEGGNKTAGDNRRGDKEETRGNGWSREGGSGEKEKEKISRTRALKGHVN